MTKHKTKISAVKYYLNNDREEGYNKIFLCFYNLKLFCENGTFTIRYSTF
jgi:hypothetical protein